MKRICRYDSIERLNGQILFSTSVNNRSRSSLFPHNHFYLVCTHSEQLFAIIIRFGTPKSTKQTQMCSRARCLEIDKWDFQLIFLVCWIFAHNSTLAKGKIPFFSLTPACTPDKAKKNVYVHFIQSNTVLIFSQYWWCGWKSELPNAYHL